MPKQQVVLVFGESQNDMGALKELVLALKPNCPSVQPRRQPMVLMKGRLPAAAKKSAERIAQVVRADMVKSDVIAVIAHEDCDAVEPAHQELALQIESNLKAEGVPNPIAATPAWEIETWWYLWPAAVAAVCAGWRPLKRHGQAVGHIENAKENLTRDLRPAGKAARAPDYEERHSVKIAEYIKKMNIIHDISAKSASYELFSSKIINNIEIKQ